MTPAQGSSQELRARLLAISVQYAHGQVSRSLIQVSVTAVLWGGCHVGGMALMQASPVLGLLGAALTAMFVVRLFMIQHDCGHRSFFRSPRANDLLGFCLGVITMTPYGCWRRFHAQHHTHSGNLDERGMGDIHTLTTREYAALTPWRQRMYRIYRHPLVLLVIGPPLLFLLRQRTTYKVPVHWRAERRSVHLTNLGIAASLALLCLVHEPVTALTFQMLVMSFAAIVGVWLFYVQHQFPEAYWAPQAQWEAWRASMRGASYYELPRVLRWLTANIGLHHIHHLDARIPNYRLHECFERHAEFANPPRLGPLQAFECLHLRLWDADAQRMVPFPTPSRGPTMEQP